MDPAQPSAELLVTIKDLLDDVSLELEPVSVTSTAMLVPVSWVHATEQLDPRPHLRPSELVCTLGSALVRPRTSRAFVEAVVDAGASGICLGLGEVHLEPPHELVEACARVGLPLLQMPHGVPFLAVNDAVLRRRNQLESEVRRQETALLSKLMTLARGGMSEEDLLQTAERSIGGTLHRPTEDDRDRLAESGRPAQPTSYGLLAWHGEGAAPSEVFLLQLASVLDVASREQERERIERQQQLGQLFELIGKRLAHPAVVMPDIEASGLDQGRLRVSSWPEGSEGAVASRWPEALVGSTGRDVVVVSAPDLVSSIRGLGLVCGYSGIVQLGGLGGAVREARAALRLARSRGGLVGPEQLVNLEALLEQQPAERLAPFIEQLLAPIIRADEDGRGDLIETLTTFIAADRHLQATADRLFVHVNTVRHRLGRIQELSGRDPFSLSGIADLRIALWAAERRHTVGSRMIRPLP